MAKKSVKKKSIVKKGARYGCKVCGMIVRVDNICNCIDICDIVCCGNEMRIKK